MMYTLSADVVFVACFADPWWPKYIHMKLCWADNDLVSLTA